MIVKANQYTNLKTNSVLKNKIRCVNTTTQKVIISNDIKAQTFSQSFSLPDNIDLANKVNIDPKKTGLVTCGESAFVDIEQDYTFDVPTEINKVKVSFNTVYNYTEDNKPYKWKAKNDQFYPPQPPPFTIDENSLQSTHKRNQEFFDGPLTNSGKYKNQNIYTEPATGAINLGDITIEVPVGNQQALSVVNTSLTTATLRGTIPVYSLACSFLTQAGLISPSSSTWDYTFRAKEWILSSITVEMYARTINKDEMVYRTTVDIPEYELPSNELTQSDATILDAKQQLNRLTSTFLSPGKYLISCPYPIASNLSVTVEGTLGYKETFQLAIGETEYKIDFGSIWPIVNAIEVTPHYDNKYIYDYKGMTAFTKSLIPSTAQHIIQAMYKGKQIVELTLLDENVQLRLGDYIQVQNKLGQLIGNNKQFEVYSIQTEITSSVRRIIKAMEVTTDGRLESKS